MLRKMITVLIVTSIFALQTYAAETVVTENVILTEEEIKPQIYTLSLNEAIEIALKDNPQLEVCKIKKDNYKTQLSAAKINKSKYKDNRVVYVSSGYETVYVRGGYYVDSYADAVDLCDYEYKQIEATVTYNVTQKYFNYKNSEKLLEIAGNSYKLMQENYDNTKLSYEYGLVSKSDLDNTEFNLKKAKYMVEQYQNNLEIAEVDFKIALRKNNENCSFKLTSNIPCEDYTGVLEEDLINAEKSRYDINSLKSNYELSKKYLDLTGLPEESARYTSAYSNFVTAQYNYTNNKDLILLGVKTSFNNILSSKNDLDVANNNLELKNNDLRIANIKFEQGMITNAELTSAMNNVAQAEIELENAKLAYKLAVEKYKHEISIGL